MSKKVLMISTSPRKNGNSETLADAFLKGVIDGGNTAEKIKMGEIDGHSALTKAYEMGKAV